LAESFLNQQNFWRNWECFDMWKKRTNPENTLLLLDTGLGAKNIQCSTTYPFIMDPMYIPPSPLSLLWPTMLIPRKLYFSAHKII